MIRRFIRRQFPLGLLLVATAACDGGAPWADREEPEATATEPDFGPTAAYNRRLLFLGPGSVLPTAAIFDFASLSDSASLRRGVRLRLLENGAWSALLDDGWEMDPMREPWRLVPHGPMKIVVGDAGDVDALSFDGEPPLRLEPGLTIAEHSPDAGTQLVLRQGRLVLGGSAVPGVLLDAQLGRALSPSGPPPQPTAEGDSAFSPTPAPRPGAEALLVDNAGYYAVFGRSAAGDLAWIHSVGRNDSRRGARLDPSDWELDSESGLRLPTSWRVVAPGDILAGELTVEASDPARLEQASELTALGYVVVTGWIEDRGVRRDVYGLVRHVW